MSRQLFWSFKLLLALIITLSSTQASAAQIRDKSSSGRTNRILFVMTSHDTLGSSGRKTGNFFPEFAHPYNILIQDFSIDFASPKGGNTPIDPISLLTIVTDSESKAFLANNAAMEAIRSTLTLDEVNSEDYDAIFFPGGNGPMYDLADNPKAASLAKEIYEAGGIVASVCHGTAGLVNVKLSNGQYLIEGRNITGFSNAEEQFIGVTKYLPFLLESQIKANGGNYSKAKKIFGPWVLVDGRIVTGQNPASSQGIGEALHRVLMMGS